MLNKAAAPSAARAQYKSTAQSRSVDAADSVVAGVAATRKECESQTSPASGSLFVTGGGRPTLSIRVGAEGVLKKAGAAESSIDLHNST